MKTDEVADQYSFHPLFVALEDDEEGYDNSPLVIIAIVILFIIGAVILAATIGLYFGLHHFKPGQYHHSLRWLEFIIPALFLTGCSRAFYLYFWGRPHQAEDEEEMEDLDD